MSKVLQAVAGVAEIAVGVATGQAWLVGIGVSTELSLIAGLLSPSKGSVIGSSETPSYDPTRPRSFVVGTANVPGSFLFEFSHDILPHMWDNAADAANKGKNRVKQKIFGLADHECDGLVEVWDGSRKLTLGTEDATLGFPIVEYHQSGRDHLWVKFHSGAWDQAADNYLVNASHSEYLRDTSKPQGWTSNAKGRWVCYVSVTAAATKDSSDTTWSAGEPDLHYVIRGAKFYNPAKDTSVGGSGSHRWGTLETYEWTDNEPVIRYNVIRGFYRPDGKLFYGVEASHDEVRFADAVAAIAMADEDVPLKAGGTEKRYRAGGEVTVDREPREFIQALQLASAGRTVTYAGKWRIFVGAFNEPTNEFTDEDCFPREAYEDEPKRPSANGLINAVYATFTNPAEGWVSKALPLRRSSVDVTTDGGIERSTSLSLDLVFSGTQGQRVQEIVRRRARRQITASRVLHPRFYDTEPGDCLAWTSARLGYDAKTFWVPNVQISGSPKLLNVTPALQEDDADIYDWVAADDELDVVPVDLASASIPEPLLPIITGATVGTRTGADGSKVPILHIEFEDPEDGSATGVTVQIRKVGTAEVVEHKYKEATAGVADIVQGLLAETAQEFRAAFDALPGRDTQWTDWTAFTTEPSALKTLDEHRVADSDRGIRDLTDQQDKLAAALINASWASQQGLATMGATVANASFTLDKKITDGLSAAAVALLLLTARVDGILEGDSDVSLTSRVTVLESANADLYLRKAWATDLTDLSSQINDPSGGILAQITTINATIATLDPSSSAATITQTATAVRTAEQLSEEAGNALVGALQLLSDTTKRVNATIAYYTSTIDARVTENQNAIARSTHELGVTLQDADATLSAHIIAEQVARADAVSAEATNRLAGDASINAVIGGGFSGGSTITAQFSTEQTARAAGDAANATSISQLASYFGTGIDATHTAKSLIDAEASTRATADTAEATNRVSGDAAITAVIGGGFSSGSTITAQFSTEQTARVAGDAANASSISTLASYFGAGIDATNTVASKFTTEASTRAAADAANASDITTIFSYFGAGIDGAHTVASKITTEASTRASADAANASDITTIYSYFGAGIDGSHTVAAAISSEATTRASGDSALSSTITVVSAQVGNVYAGGLFRVAAAATASGSDATISLAASASSGGSPYTAGLYLDARSTGETRITAIANAFYISDGSNNAKPFVFTGSTLYVNALVATSALVGALDASTITVGTLDVQTLVTSQALTISESNLNLGPTATGGGLSSFADVLTFTVVGRGGDVSIDVSFMFKQHGGSSASYTSSKFELIDTLLGHDVLNYPAGPGITFSTKCIDSGSGNSDAAFYMGAKFHMPLANGLTRTFKLRCHGDSDVSGSRQLDIVNAFYSWTASH